MVVMVLAVALSPSGLLPSERFRPTDRSPPSPSAPSPAALSGPALPPSPELPGALRGGVSSWNVPLTGACSSPAACTAWRSAWRSSRWRFLFERSPSSSLPLLFVSFGAALIAFATPPPPSPPPARRSSSSSSSKNDEGGPRRAAISPSAVQW